MNKTLNQISAKIKKLTEKLSKKKLCENFGSKEISELSNYIGDIWSYDCDERVEVLKMENRFIEWCYTYTGEK